MQLQLGIRGISFLPRKVRFRVKSYRYKQLCFLGWRGDITKAHIGTMDECDLSNIVEDVGHVSIYNARYGEIGARKEKAECYVCRGYGEHYLYIVSTGGRTAGGWYYAHFCSRSCLNLMLLRYV